MTLLARVVAVLQSAGVSHALIGAGALTVHGVNRATHDLDLLTVQEARIPVVRAVDLILLKLYAGGAQDGWDVQQLLEGEGRNELIVEVEKLLPELSPRAAQLWRRVLES